MEETAMKDVTARADDALKKLDEEERRAEELLAALPDEDRFAVEWLINRRYEDETYESELRERRADASVTLVPGCAAARVTFTATELRHLQAMVRGGWGSDPDLKRWEEILAANGIDEKAWHRVMWKVDGACNGIAGAQHFLEVGEDDD